VLDKALLRWLRVVQSLHYPTEIVTVSRNRALPRQNHLRALNPYVDDSGALRVGGRLKHAKLSFDERHPLIVPPRSQLTRLLVESYHRRTLHGGVQLTLGMLRLRFWIPRDRAVVKHWLRQCFTCTKWRAAKPQPLIGDLPQGRVSPARPFLRTGVDYAGSILIRASKGRVYRTSKAFIAIFVCLCSTAVHIKAVSDYSTEAFLAAFRRFISRLCSDVYSDCGTNFAGANRQLRELFRASSSESHRIVHAVASEGIRSHFNLRVEFLTPFLHAIKPLDSRNYFCNILLATRRIKAGERKINRATNV